MAMNVGQMSTQVATRVRDPQFLGTSQANTILLLSFAQQVVNGILGDVVSSQGLTLAPRTVIYSISGSLPSCVKVLSVRDASNRDIAPLYEGVVDLANIDLRWPVAVSDDGPYSYGAIGRDVLAFHPGVPTATPVTVYYSELTPTLATGQDTTVVPDEDDHAVLDLTELLLLLKNRDLQPVEDALKRFAGRMKELQTEER